VVTQIGTSPEPSDRDAAQAHERSAATGTPLDQDAAEALALGSVPANALRLEDVVHTVALRWRLLLSALVVPWLIGLGAALMSQPKYTAEAVLMVLVNRETSSAPDLSGYGPSVISVEMLKVVRSEVEILQSTATIRLALQKVGVATIFPNIAHVGWFGSPPDEKSQLDSAVEEFALSLRTDADANANIVRVDFVSASPQISVAAVQALVDAYQERRSQIFLADGSRILGEQIANYEGQLTEAEAEIQRVRAKYSVIDITQEQQLASVRRDSVAQRLAQVREQLAANQAQLTTATKLLSSQPPQVMSEQEATNTAPNDDGRNMLARMLQERQHLATTYAPDYAPLRDLDQRIAVTRQTLESNRSGITSTRQTRNPLLETLSQRILALNLDQSALAEQHRALEQQAQSETQRASELRQAELQLRELQEHRNALADVVRQLTTHEAGNRIAEESGGLRNPSVRVLQEAAAPRKGRSLRRVIFAGGLVGGGVLASALGLLLALTRRVFATPAEVARALALPCLASFMPFKAASRDGNAAAIGDLASLLIDEAQGGQSLGIIQLIGTDANDQRDLLARYLAVDLQHLLCRPVRLIDMMGDGGGELSSLIDPNLRQDAVAEQMTKLRAEFGAVIVIGPANVAAYGVRRLSGLIDTNILVVHFEVSRGDVAKQTIDQLEQAGAHVRGFAFTGQRAILPPIVEKFL